MVFGGRYFTLEDAIGDRNIAGATIVTEDVTEFMRTIPESERTSEETEMVFEIGDLDFVVSIHREEMRPSLLFHELCHVLFHYDEGYRRQITSLWNGFDEDVKQEITGRLKRSGYEDIELIVEWFAHLFCGFADKGKLMECNSLLTKLFYDIEHEFFNLDWSESTRIR